MIVAGVKIPGWPPSPLYETLVSYKVCFRVCKFCIFLVLGLLSRISVTERTNYANYTVS